MVSTDFPWLVHVTSWKNRGRAGAHQMSSCGGVYSSKKWNFEKIFLFSCWKLFWGKHVFHTSFHKKSPFPGYIRAGRFYYVKINFARYKHRTDFHLYPCCHLEFWRESRLHTKGTMENVLHPMSRSRTDWNVELGVGVGSAPVFPWCTSVIRQTTKWPPVRKRGWQWFLTTLTLVDYILYFQKYHLQMQKSSIPNV